MLAKRPRDVGELASDAVEACAREAGLQGPLFRGEEKAGKRKR